MTQTTPEQMAYINWHNKLRKLRGKASEHQCACCGGPAREWALKPEHHAFERFTFVPDPDAYQPMCRPCHVHMDGSWKAGVEAARKANALDPELRAKRRKAGLVTGAKMRARTHCKNGHEYTPENTNLVGNRRRCRTCDREYQRRYNQRRRT